MENKINVKFYNSVFQNPKSQIMMGNKYEKLIP